MVDCWGRWEVCRGEQNSEVAARMESVVIVVVVVVVVDKVQVVGHRAAKMMDKASYWEDRHTGGSPVILLA